MNRINSPFTTIATVKRSPINIFQKAAQENAGVYVYNRENIVGVMITIEQYQSLFEEIDQLSDQLDDLTAEKRLLNKSDATISDISVRGSLANKIPVIDEKDGWI